jgi:glycosyl transferase family 25
MVGCGISHMKCWRAVVDQNLPYALILEDDAYLLPNFRRKMISVLQNVPQDFHVLLLGCFLCEMNPDSADGKVREIKNFAGTHAYIVSQKGARFLMDNAPRVEYHIDIQMHNIPGVKIYAPRTNLAVQNGEETSSNVQVHFPGSLNRLFASIKDGDNMSMSHYLNSSYLRIGTMRHHIVITPLLLLFGLVGLLGVPWKLVALYSLIDFAYFPPTSLTDPMIKLSFYAVGLWLRILCWR